ncbi:uncharacterized protein LOC111708091 isoform X2 [Eurytemora carolleeae]|uniref:uncharacterized protein LOC111708091 isoform X2 n=1 Tax=Eurytemora carolleeae TaxID=1294199 RepID=UPI000C76B4B3|nr:uncharacterized protein LOC111708091 isoform X2 [Eurytemora carolleeae]|eukprot:XP_023337123.1 uncharacterized protein LOC111708091 isoform X2 [Eurytemora affinis]
MGSRTQAVYPSKLLRQNGPRLTPADRRYWEEVRDENLRLFHTIQVNSGAKPHHADRGNSVSFAPEVKPLLRSQTPSEKKYWRGVETENLRLLNRILKIQGYAKRSRSVSTPPSYPYPKPSELEYWSKVRRENIRLLNTILDIKTRPPSRGRSLTRPPRPDLRGFNPGKPQGKLKGILKSKDSQYQSSLGVRECYD